MRAEPARTDAFRHFGSRGLGHLDGLDGVRGLALLAVLFFHGNWTWMKGGFLGVSLFFTLSGFLITSLLLVELDGRDLSHPSLLDVDGSVGSSLRRGSPWLR